MAAIKQTSRSIRNRVDRLSLLPAPAPADRGQLLAEWLTYDAQRRGEAIAVRSDARGDLHFYETSPGALKVATRARQSGAGQLYAFAEQLLLKYTDPELHFGRQRNSEKRAAIRRYEKTAAGDAEKAARDRKANENWRLRCRIEDLTKSLGDNALVPGTWRHRWANGLYIPVLPDDCRAGDTKLTAIVDRETARADLANRDETDADRG